MDRVFLQLKSKSEDKRYAAQGELHDLVVSAARGKTQRPDDLAES